MERTISETIAHALYDAGVKVVTCVPGFGASEVFASFKSISGQQAPVSFNEEPAYTIAHGASLAGARSATLVKSHGIVKAGNSVSDSLFSGTTAGMLSVVFADRLGQHSDSILDVESFLKGIGIPHESADTENVYRQVFHLLEVSEKSCLPHALVIESSEVSRLVRTEKMGDNSSPGPAYRRDIAQRLLCPFFTQYQGLVLQHKNGNRDWLQVPPPAMPRMPDSLPANWKPIAEAYSVVFSVFRKVRGAMVTGETGISSLFAFEPYGCVDVATYMGGSVPLAVGAYLAGYPDVWAVTGDFAFIAAGHLGLLEAKQRQIPLKVLVLNNGKSATTGGQPITEGTLETILRGYDEHVIRISNPYDSGEVEEVLKRTQQSRDLAIVVADYAHKC